MTSDTTLRSKRELIERFVQSTMPNITNSSDVEAEFAKFWSKEQVKAFRAICEEEGLDNNKAQELLDRYMSSGRIPRNHDLADVLRTQPSVPQRENIVTRAKNRLVNFIETFIEVRVLDASLGDKQEDKTGKYQEIRFYPFIPKKNLKKRQLSPTARRANYKMFNYVGLDRLPYFILFQK